jgi:hypothetical protein
VAPATNKTSSGVLVLGVNNLATLIAKCCKPVPPDAIVGFITRARGVMVHRQDCPNIVGLAADQRDRLLAADWGRQSEEAGFSADLEVVAVDRQGLAARRERGDLARAHQRDRGEHALARRHGVHALHAPGVVGRRDHAGDAAGEGRAGRRLGEAHLVNYADVRERVERAGGSATQLRLLLEELCCDLVRFAHVCSEGLAPESIAVDREVYMGTPGAFADIRVQPTGRRPYFVEVKFGYPDDVLAHHLARKYGPGFQRGDRRRGEARARGRRGGPQRVAAAAAGHPAIARHPAWRSRCGTKPSSCGAWRSASA